MERIKPKRDEIWYYHGNKSNIKGMFVRCVGNFNNRAGNIKIRGHKTQTEWDNRTWSCQIRYLRPYNTTPDWEL